MPRLVTEIKQSIIDRIGLKIYKMLTKYVGDHPPKNLWGMNRNRNFNLNVLLATLYKDLYAKSYADLEKDFKRFLKLSRDSWEHNIQAMRKVLGEWGETTVERGTKGEWDKVMRNRPLPKHVQGVNLWGDSTDFRLIGKQSSSTGSPDCSHKLGAPAQRYMIFMDGKGRVRLLRGGYSPKVADSQWLAMMKEEIDEQFSGGVLVWDCGAYPARNSFEKLTILACKPAPKKRKRGCDKFVVLTKEEETRNSQIRSIRGSVESTFAFIDRKFDGLKKQNPFREGKTQQDYLVRLAVGVHNHTNK
jgi:hypothetical protein